MYIDIMYMYINTYEYIYLKIFVLKILYINSKQNIFLFIYLSTFPGYFFILLFFMILLVYLLSFFIILKMLKRQTSINTVNLCFKKKVL
jgi:hypothetical protein